MRYGRLSNTPHGLTEYTQTDDQIHPGSTQAGEHSVSPGFFPTDALLPVFNTRPIAFAPTVFRA